MKEAIIARLEFAIDEAERFLLKAKDARLKISCDLEDSYHSKSFASAKRSSLDMAQALVELRKSLYS